MTWQTKTEENVFSQNVSHFVVQLVKMFSIYGNIFPPYSLKSESVRIQECVVLLADAAMRLLPGGWMPVGLPVRCSASFRLNQNQRINDDPATGHQPSLARFTRLHQACSQGKLHFPFKYLPLLRLRSVVINLPNKGTICLTYKLELCFAVLWLRWMLRVKLKHVEQRKHLLKWCRTSLPVHPRLPAASPLFSKFPGKLLHCGTS